ncbi:YehS family protein [Weissella soli]|uniref:Uncharacterized protein YehS (DUF1456 family) n=2 Tax=Weissella soli TaxID=155866 RepID=A0A288Q6B6_9LACO|nr:DUF1456 family protein [Weissella soli]AOT56489.1 uncharacterized protein WSWS_00855 [Weissella soli]NKY82940.1 DUF1456 family protein [Weissella soli]RDL12057.1 uncharacterized protein YehS (DUF1456 family) [Weissella soli]GEN92713.1 hypothetical protein WSO01_03250 [Weissella soli]
MNNNDIVRRIRYAYDIKDADMIKIFGLGGLEITKARYREIMTQQAKDTPRDEKLSRHELEQFMNGLIITQRGVKLAVDGQPMAPNYSMNRDNQINNVVFKKLKIAMQYTSEDILGFMMEAGFTMSNAEITDILRASTHKKYKIAGDQFLRKLLHGINLVQRPDTPKDEEIVSD